LPVAEATAVKALAVAAGRWAVDMRVEAIMLAIGGGRVAGKRWNATGRGERKEEEARGASIVKGGHEASAWPLSAPPPLSASCSHLFFTMAPC
jgi:hypothetical protein